MIEERNGCPKVAVVLSSGGLKTVAAIALFEYLQAEKIDVDFFVGCSGGAMMAALHNSGYGAAEITEIAKGVHKHNILSKFDVRAFLNIFKLPFGRFNIRKGLMKKDLPLKVLREIFSDRRLEDFTPPLFVHTTDAQTGEGLVLEKGRVADVIYATGGFYPIFPPIQMENRLLTDGVYSAPLPIMEAVKREADIIIALNAYENVIPEPKSFMDGMGNITRSLSKAVTQSQLALARAVSQSQIIVIDVPANENISLTDIEKIPHLVAAGHRAIMEKDEEIKCALANFAVAIYSNIHPFPYQKCS